MRELRKITIFSIQPNDDNHIQQNKRISTIISIILLLACLTAFTLYSSLVPHLKIGTFKSPTLEQYQHMLSEHSTTVCSCSQLAIRHRDFIRFRPTFHQVCFSHFINHEWIDFLNQIYQASNFTPILGDFRVIAFSQFSTLQRLCQLVNRTVSQGVLAFNTEYFVTPSLSSRERFQSQLHTLTNTFISSMSDDLMQTIDLLRITTSGNQLYPGVLIKWNLMPDSMNTLYSIPIKYSWTSNNISECDCSQHADTCIQETSIDSWYISGFQTGCYLFDALLKSTLECFYNTTCFSPIGMATAVALDSTIPSRYPTNATIREFLTHLMIEEWNVNAVYELYFNMCNASECTYTYASGDHVVVVLSNVIGLLGGLTMILGAIVPWAVNFIRRKRSSTNVALGVVAE